MSSSSNYIPFARKYRPTNFSELLGQETLVKILSNAIRNSRISNAYLLTGIRGVGKTSSARIIAKTVNCENKKLEPDYVIACGECNNCKNFTSNSHPDIIEIDAASNTGIEDIKNIVSGIEYKPLLGKFKFLIIDEVHMLSKSAFNALLKSIEEPPEHMVFILATTELQKIPSTIISRCQRYDLRRLGFNEIVDLVSDISKKEKIELEQEAIAIIASKSEGSGREAVAMVDQAVSYAINSEQNTKLITADLINNMLGQVDVDKLLTFVELIISSKPAAAIDFIKELYFKAYNLEYLIKNVSDFIAELNKYKIIEQYDNPLYSRYINRIKSLISDVDVSKLSILWQIFSNAILDIKNCHNSLIFSEMLVIKAICASYMPSMDDLVKFDEPLKIEKKENLVKEHIVKNETKLDKQPVEQQRQEDKENVSNLQDVKTDFIKEKINLDISKSDEEKIYSFLKFCYQKSEIELYYLLLNEAEINKFSDEDKIVELKTKGNINSTLLKSMLAEWSVGEWRIVHAKKDSFISLKDKLIEKVKNTEAYKFINDKAPNSIVSDIILKK